MRTGRIAAIFTVLTALAGGVAGCADTLAGTPTAGPTGPSLGASTASSAPGTTTTRAGRPRPRELDLRGLDACSTLTEQQRAQFGLDGTPQSSDDDMLGRACTIRSRQRNMGAAVVLATRMGLAEWDEMTSGERQPIVVAGFPADRAPHHLLPYDCSVEVDVADGQFLIGSFADHNRPPTLTQDQVCDEALRIAEAAMATLLARR